jgi:hypothetical protein
VKPFPPVSLYRCIALSLSVCTAALCSCASDPSQGYSFESTYAKNVHTISIPVFENVTYTPGIEVQLTEAVIKEVQRSTGLRVTSQENADSSLHVVLQKADMRRLTLQQTTGLVQEVAVQLTVDFEWKDSRTGKTLVARKNFSAADTFVPDRLVGERVETGQEATVQRLARDIVAEMRSTW